MKKSFNLNSVFTDMYFEDRKSPSIGLQNPIRMPAPSDGWNLEPKNQSERTLSPIMRREQTDDIMVNDDSRIKNKLPNKSKKKEKSYKELGVLPTKKRLKFITENPSDSGHSMLGPGSSGIETNNENKAKPIPVRKPQHTVRENNVEWLDKLSSILPDWCRVAYRIQDILSEKIKKYNLHLDDLLALTKSDIKTYFMGNRRDFGGFIRQWGGDDVLAAASVKKFTSIVKSGLKFVL